MFSKNSQLNVEATSVKASETRQANTAAPKSYHTPELHTVGKAGALVQGGGGGNYLDANRSRYY